jgi:hypothetical protein
VAAGFEDAQFRYLLQRPGQPLVQQGDHPGAALQQRGTTKDPEETSSLRSTPASPRCISASDPYSRSVLVRYGRRLNISSKISSPTSGCWSHTVQT